MTRLSIWGTIVKKSAQKTVKVRVENDYVVPLYNKTIVRSKNYLCHDENEKGQVGDIIRMEQIPKISLRKYFNLAEIVLPSLKYMTDNDKIESLINGYDIGLKRYLKSNTTSYKTFKKRK